MFLFELEGNILVISVSFELDGSILVISCRHPEKDVKMP